MDEELKNLGDAHVESFDDTRLDSCDRPEERTEAVSSGIGSIKMAAMAIVLLAAICGKEKDAIAQQDVRHSPSDSPIVQMEGLSQFNIDTASDYQQGLDMIYDFLEVSLYDADSVEQKIAVYKAAIRKYTQLEGKSGITDDQRRRISRSKEYLQAKIDALEAAPSDGRYDYTWFDDNNDIDLLRFTEQFPGLVGAMMDDVKKMFMSSNNDKGSLDQRIQFYDDLIRQLQKRVFEDCAERERSLEFSLRWESNPQAREKLVAQYRELQEYTAKLRHFLNRFGIYSDWMKTAQKAYDRYIVSRDQIETTIKKRIDAGEIRVPKDAPYVIFVNRDVDGQYAVVYKYDRKSKSLILKTYTLVSTGSATRWLEERGADLSTPATIFHIGHVFSAKAAKPSGVVYGSSYGAQYVDRDQEPYKIYSLRQRMKDDSQREWVFYMHGTDEEHLLGSPQSHGCIRIPRIFNLAVMRIFLKHYYKKYAASGSPKDEQRIRDFEDIDFTGYGDAPLQIPVVVANVKPKRR